MSLPQTYSLSDLEAESGFDKRTIAYYIAEGLLPKVGRRGPKTRYPEGFLERLMFIRRVRELQDEGKLRAVTLPEIRAVMNELTQDELRSVLRSSGFVDWIRGRFADPDRDTSMLAIPAERVAASMSPSADLQAVCEERRADSVANSSAAYGMASMRQRRNALQEDMYPQASRLASRVELGQRPAATENARPENETHRVEEAMHRFENRVDRMHEMQNEMREGLQRDLREMKQLVLGLHDRLKAVEDRIKSDAEIERDELDSSEK